MPAGSFTIGNLARATGAKAEMIRYYERIGIMPEPARSGGNYRVYSEDHARRLAFVRAPAAGAGTSASPWSRSATCFACLTSAIGRATK